MAARLALLALSTLLLSAGCRTTSAADQVRLQRELGAKVPLWVDVECTKRGRPKFVEYSVLKMPDEKVGWAMANLEGECRIYGTLVHKSVKRPDLCDIRFRSKDAFGKGKRCKCQPGRTDLQEGTPTSKRCCEKYPDKVYCKEKHGPSINSDQDPESTP